MAGQNVALAGLSAFGAGQNAFCHVSHIHKVISAPNGKGQLPGKIGFFQEQPEYGLELFENKKSKCDKAVAIDMLLAVLPLFQNLPNWEQQTIHDGLIDLAASLGVKNATLMWPVRIAVSGQAVTPGGAVEICHILGRYEALNRISAAMARLMTE